MSRKITMVEYNPGIYRVKKLNNVPPGIVVDGGIIDFNERYNEDNLRDLFEALPKMQIDLEVECR
tara:strand:- start:61 stop:255 length:195 start_codon:yes stop_codon:yes gene_type:complete